jgi:hypothetical protein
MTVRGALPWPALLLAAMSMCGTAQAQHAPPDGAGVAAKAAVQACIDRIDGSVTGLPKLEERCPELPDALQSAGVRPLIIDSSRSLLDRESLRRLSGLIHPANGPRPSVAALAPILRQLQGTAAPPRSWWRRLWDWVLDHFANGKPDDAANPWWAAIKRLLSRAQWLWTGLIWATIIALPIAVVILVVREVRAMGKRSVDDPLAAAGATRRSGRLDSQLALLRRAPLGQRPAQLFAMLIARLVTAGRLPPDRSLTHREVVRKVLLEDAQQRQLIESLARLSERQLYSAVAETPAGLEGLLAQGEDLYTVGWSRPVVNP